MTYLEKFLNWKAKVAPEDIWSSSHNSPSFVIYHMKMTNSIKALREKPDNKIFYLTAISALKRFMGVANWIDFGDDEPEIEKRDMRLFFRISAETKLDRILRWQFLVVNSHDDWSLIWSTHPYSMDSVWIKLENLDLVHRGDNDLLYVETVFLFEQLFEDMANFGCETTSVPPPIQGFEDLYTSFKVMNL